MYIVQNLVKCKVSLPVTVVNNNICFNVPHENYQELLPSCHEMVRDFLLLVARKAKPGFVDGYGEMPRKGMKNPKYKGWAEQLRERNK